VVRAFVFSVVVALAGCGRNAPRAPLDICDLARDFGRYRDKVVAVRGAFCYGLRGDTCSGRCGDRAWPAFIELAGSEGSARSEAELQRAIESAVKTGKPFEVRVTAIGVLRTNAHHSPRGPCDWIGSGYYGYGHLGFYPAELQVKEFTDIEVKENPKSPYDYGRAERPHL
jgi:hypothetical protein